MKIKFLLNPITLRLHPYMFWITICVCLTIIVISAILAKQEIKKLKDNKKNVNK